MGKINVLMSCYNGEKFVDEQIKSILEQKTERQIELYIRDDGSKDNTCEVLRKYENVPNVHVIFGKNAGVMVTYFVDDETAPAKEVTLDFENVKSENGVKVEYFLLDETHDLEKVREETFTAESFSAYLDMPVYSSYYVKVTAL